MCNPSFKNRTDNALLARVCVVHSRLRGGVAYLRRSAPWKRLSFHDGRSVSSLIGPRNAAD